MDYRQFNRNHTFRIDFVVDGEFVVPDADSVFYSVVMNDGNIPLDVVGVPIITDESSTYVTISVPSQYNSRGDLEIERRTLIVTFRVDDAPHEIRHVYTLIDWLNYSAVPGDVRRYIGVGSHELLDDDVDLVKAYFAVKEDLGNIDLNTLLTSGSRHTFLANDIIVYRAVLDVLPSLQLRVAQVEQSDQSRFQRLSKINLEELGRRASQQYADAVRQLRGITGEEVSLFILGGGTDPVTGA